ncbi:MAG TPA: carboxypeptidase-like regulatory domain-containing protein [Bryobacteraceae bacterium]|nr:carboxypeptidase-like regulatory domain-containing protein [Bryobacteraceae bacterium]
MKLPRHAHLALLSVSLLSLCSLHVNAQSATSGTVEGQVTDQQGAQVAGAEIKLIDPTTNTALSTKSNSDGRYLFVNVKPGSYDVTFTMSGFSIHKVSRQDVLVGQVLTLNAILQVGAVSSVVEVTGLATAELQTVNATIGTTVSGSSLTYLPIFGSDSSSLALIQPGVTPDGAVAGAMYDQNTFQLDGGNNSNDMDGSMRDYTGSYGHNSFAGAGNPPSGVLPTPPDTVEEFKVDTAGQTADFNGSSGAQVQMVTKRGTNDFHGTAYWYYHSSDIGGANTWDNNHTPSGNLGYTPIPIAHDNRYGGTVGGPMLPSFLGGKTYFFFGYEGFNFPQSQIINKQVPADTLRAGVIQINQAGAWVPYNLNPYPVTVNGVTYQPAACTAGACDPRGIGMNPVVQTLWKQYMPEPNNTNVGDAHNIAGFQGQVSLPTTSKFLVGRLDHDFGDKWRFFGSYRYYALSTLTTNQIDIGGALPGDKLGVPASRAPRPQKPDFLVGGLTTTINPTTTNDFRVSYTKIWWQWATSAAPPQLPGLGGALEIGGETANALIPYNVNNQNTRQRFWDGHDTMFKDDVSKIWGNHILQFGGNYQRNWDYHLRNDNGQGINTSPVYQIGNQVAGTAYTSATQPAGLPSNQVTNWNKYYSYVLGIVDQPQQLFTRSGSQLSLNPVGTPMFDQDTINFYNLYISDTWHLKPSLTLTYGLGYQIEMPPVEQNGKQVELVDTAGHPISFDNYFNTKAAQALQGQVYNPTLGFATIGNVTGASHKYPFNPFYGGLSPRVAVAWNPKYNGGILGKIFGDGKTVIRAGYGQIYSRLNGVGLVLLPLLGVGLGEPAACVGASITGQCLGTGGVTPATAFRIGTDGLVAPIPVPSRTLPQPYFPGANGTPAAGAASVLDPNFRPAATYNINFSIQRQITNRVLFETGYIGRKITHEFQQRDINAVPTMLTLNGQSFASAFAQTYFAVAAGNTPAPQPWFESALGGANSAFCKGYSSCTAAVVANPSMNSFISLTQVFQLWSALSNAKSWTLGRTIPSSIGTGFPSGQAVAINADDSSGSGNYNALYTTFTMRDWHGVTTTSNFTWGRALGTGSESQATSGYTALNPYNVRQSMYGPQFYDYKFLYTQSFLWSEPFFRNNRGILGYALGGWRFGAILTARSGAPLAVATISGDGFSESFGEGQNSAVVNAGTTFASDAAVLASTYTGGSSAHYNVNVASSASGAGINTNTSNGGNNLNMFANPAAIYNEFRPCILGYDTSCGGNGQIRGMPSWNMDANIAKDFRLFRERVFGTLSFQFTNLFNHVVLNDPYLDLSDPANFGVLGSNNPSNPVAGQGQANNPRQITFNLRLRF